MEVDVRNVSWGKYVELTFREDSTVITTGLLDVDEARGYADELREAADDIDYIFPREEIDNG